MGVKSSPNGNIAGFKKPSFRKNGCCFLSRRLKKVSLDDSATASTEHSYRSLTFDGVDDIFKVMGHGHIGPGFVPTVSVVAYSSEEVPNFDEDGSRPAEASLRFDQHVVSHSTVISLEFEKNVGIWSMVTYLDHNLRRHLRLVRRGQKHAAEDGLLDEYLVRQCQQIVAEGLGSNGDKNTANQGTVVDILCDVKAGRVAVSVNGKKPEVIHDCSELAAACINMFTGKQSCSPSLRRDCIKKSKLQRRTSF